MEDLALLAKNELQARAAVSLLASHLQGSQSATTKKKGSKNKDCRLILLASCTKPWLIPNHGQVSHGLVWQDPSHRHLYQWDTFHNGNEINDIN